MEPMESVQGPEPLIYTSAEITRNTFHHHVSIRAISIMVQVLLLLPLIVFLYHSILAQLVGNWWNDANYSHGFLIPLFSLVVAWQQKKKLLTMPLAPSSLGLAIIGGALIALIVGVMGAELLLSRSSLVLLLAGMIVYFAGWRHFRAVLFPWAVLFLMIPIPVIIFNEIAFPLQFLASRLATSLLSISGVPVLREGNIIHLSAMSLEVVDACSGIRSLVSLTSLAVIYAYFMEPRNLWRGALTLAAIPVAVVANALRIMGTGLMVQYWDPEKAEGFFHMFSGWIIFISSLAMLYLLHCGFKIIQGQQVRAREAA